MSDAKRHLELAEKYLEEGRALVEKDSIQASEKLYKAAEEAVEALALHLGLSEVLEKVEGRGRWTTTDLEKAVLKYLRRSVSGSARRGTGRGCPTSEASTRRSLTART